MKPGTQPLRNKTQRRSKRQTFAKAPASLQLSAVPLGTMLPFFGRAEDVPSGYVLVSPKEKWPRAKWVPSHLRGYPMPDMKNLLLGGAGGLLEVGRLFQKGGIEVGGSTINANFSLPSFDVREDAETAKYKPSHEGRITGLVLELQEANRKADLGPSGYLYQFRDAADPKTFKIYKARIEPSAAAVGDQLKIPTQTVLLDSTRSSPMHLMCHWIIRVK